MSRVHYAGLSEKGLRDINEDAYCAEKIGKYYVFAVADGLGGHAAGEVASAMAIDCLRHAFKTQTGTPAEILQHAITEADSRIRAEAAKSGEERGMATTLAAACIDEKLFCTIVNVGDSRGHLISSRGFETTKDHSYVQELVDAGQIAPEDVWHHPLSNVLRQALGDPDEQIRPDFYESDLTDTYLLLSTDGLHDYVLPGWIQEIIFKNKGNVKKACSDLVEAALKNDSDDNITVVLAHGEK